MINYKKTILLLLLVYCNNLFSLTMLKTDNKKIVDASNQEIILRRSEERRVGEEC